ncbi:MAG: hemerythrin family protein [Clostridia bacterium]|nr:hemerythrin family protein [Clostridia bacterium]
MLIKWSDDLKIGVEQIDGEHQRIFEEFDKLYSLMRVGEGIDFYPMVMNFLEDYLIDHLKHEESLQRSVEYTDYDNHKQMHDFFREKVNAFKSKQYRKIQNKDLIQLNLFMQQWFVEHIIKEDMKLGEFIKKKEHESSTE